MKTWFAAVLPALLLGACAAPPESGPQVSEAQVRASVAPGRTTQAGLLAALGPTTRVAFDSGYEVWRYRAAAGPQRQAEVVILLDPRGVVKKWRRREGPRETAQDKP